MDEKSTEHETKKELFSEKIRVGRRTYFFDVKQNSHGDRYLVITESKATMQTNQRYMRDRIMIFEEHINEFIATLGKSTHYLKTHPQTETACIEERVTEDVTQ